MDAEVMGALLPLHSERLILRRFDASDYVDYAAYHCLPEVYRFLYCDPPAGEDMKQQFEEAIASRVAKEGDSFHFAVERQEDGRLLGEILLKLASREALQAEIGYVLHPAFAGKGYATEATAAVVDLGFRNLGFHRIFARLDALNTGSARVMERLGFRREAHLIENDRFNDVWGDEYIYALLEREWFGLTVAEAASPITAET